jgi:hypothetical protein
MPKFKFKFKLLSGQHSENGKTYNAGEIIETNNPLDEMFPRIGKFRRIGDVPPEAEVDVTNAVDPNLVGLKVKVTQVGSLFNFYKPGAEKPVNEKPIDRKQLAKFIIDITGKPAEDATATKK